MDTLLNEYILNLLSYSERSNPYCSKEAYPGTTLHSIEDLLKFLYPLFEFRLNDGKVQIIYKTKEIDIDHYRYIVCFLLLPTFKSYIINQQKAYQDIMVQLKQLVHSNARQGEIQFESVKPILRPYFREQGIVEDVFVIPDYRGSYLDMMRVSVYDQLNMLDKDKSERMITKMICYSYDLPLDKIGDYLRIVQYDT